MRRNKKWKWPCLVLAGIFFGPVSPIHAQYYRPGFYPYAYGYPRVGNLGPGYYLQGASDVINATGNLYVQQEQARITREQANQAKIDTKRKAFDEMMYEKANTPYYTEKLEQNQAYKLRRIMNNPTETEIKTGSAHNQLLPYLKDLTNHGVMGTTVSLDQDLLRHINVIGASQSGSLGVLGNDGKVEWPLVLQGKTQKELDQLLPKAVAATLDGSLDFALYGKVKKDFAQLDDEHRKKFRKEEIDSGEYLTGRRFLDSLDGAIQLLQQPSAKQVLSGAVKADGRNISELVLNMTQKGLKFAPATPGYEASYFGLFSSMVTYASGATGSSSFRVAVSPAVPRTFISKKPPIN